MILYVILTISLSRGDDHLVDYFILVYDSVYVILSLYMTQR